MVRAFARISLQITNNYKEKNMRYEIRTIKDIFDKIPADRIEECLNELTTAMTSLKAIEQASNTIAENLTSEPQKKMKIEFPNVVFWNDDDEKEVRLEINFQRTEESI